MKPSEQSSSSRPAAMAEQAAAWLARRDRGLTPAEQDQYMEWLAADPRHADAMTQHAAALERMMQLYEWQPGHDTEPNPDLFVPRRSAWWGWPAGLVAAAALVVVGYFLVPRREAAASPVATAPKNYLHVNERMALPDGSRIELKDGSQLVVQYSDTERRVKLTGGEALFIVWKDAQRPFVVDAGGVEVRALGTAFNVRLAEQAVEVLVTEGRVGVERLSPDHPPADFAEAPFHLTKGERAVVSLTLPNGPVAPQVTAVDADEISRELAWQAPRLQFNETPLADAVAEFNRLNRHQLVIGDPRLAAELIGGTFRPDNVEGFIRLLDTTLDIRAEKTDVNTTVLRRGH